MEASVREKVAGLVVAGSTVSAITVLLGRLWTSSYFEYFGLPVADLTLDVQDYAFRTKEILVMLVLAGALVGGIASWAKELGVVPAERRSTRLRWFWIALGGAVLAFFVTFFVLDTVWPEALQDTWRWFTVGLGLALGVGGGLVVGFARHDQRSWSWIAAAAVLTILVVLIPLAIVRLARASAARDVRTQNLAHAVLDFGDGVAPEPIQRADDESRSTRVYLVLSTPERLAVAFPYPCTQVGTADDLADTAGNGTRSADLCDILTFDRSLVTNIEIVGKGGRPSNDEPAKAEPVTLGTDSVGREDFSSRIAFEQGYDFSLAARNRLECRQADGSETTMTLHGVWLAVDALQAGRVEPVDGGASTGEASPGGSRSLRFFVLDVDDRAACHELPTRRQLAVDANDGARLFVGMEQVDHENTRRTLRLRFTPLAARSDDCRIVRPPDGAPAATCPGGPVERLGLRVHVPTGAELAVSVEMADAGFAPTTEHQCPDDAALPQAFAGGTPLTASSCRPVADDDSDRVLVTLRGLVQRGGDGAVEVVACPGPDGSARIEAVRALLTLPAAGTPETTAAEAEAGTAGAGSAVAETTAATC